MTLVLIAVLSAIAGAAIAAAGRGDRPQWKLAGLMAAVASGWLLQIHLHSDTAQDTAAAEFCRRSAYQVGVLADRHADGEDVYAKVGALYSTFEFCLGPKRGDRCHGFLQDAATATPANPERYAALRVALAERRDCPNP